jgi:hypothetical protein
MWRDLDEAKPELNGAIKSDEMKRKTGDNPFLESSLETLLVVASHEPTSS